MFNIFGTRSDRETFEEHREQAQDAATRSGLSPSEASRAATANARLAMGGDRDRAAERDTLRALNRRRREENA